MHSGKFEILLNNINNSTNFSCNPWAGSRCYSVCIHAYLYRYDFESWREFSYLDEENTEKAEW